MRGAIELTITNLFAAGSGQDEEFDRAGGVEAVTKQGLPEGNPKFRVVMRQA